jgi:hypothetical protein
LFLDEANICCDCHHRFAGRYRHGGSRGFVARLYAKAVSADPGYNWSGFYVGINAGFGMGSA